MRAKEDGRRNIFVQYARLRPNQVVDVRGAYYERVLTNTLGMWKWITKGRRLIGRW